MRLSSEFLVARDWRLFNLALQPYHHLVRLLHLLSTSGFFGGIAVLDLRLLGWHRALPLQPLARQVRLPVYFLFAVTVATGLALFLYAPVKVGSHPYFTLKIILIALGLANAALFHRIAALSDAILPSPARLATVLSLAFWTGVIICPRLNVEAALKLLLR